MSPSNSPSRSHVGPAARLRKAVRLTAKPGQGAAMRAALIALQAATAAEPGCHEFEFFGALADADSFLLLEDFEDAAALALHMSLPHTQEFFARDLVASINPIAPGWLS